MYNICIYLSTYKGSHIPCMIFSYNMAAEWTPNIDTCITGEIGCVVLNKRSRVRAEIMLRSVPKLILERSSMLAYTANYIWTACINILDEWRLVMIKTLFRVSEPSNAPIILDLSEKQFCERNVITYQVRGGFFPYRVRNSSYLQFLFQYNSI